jgi:uncharacterized protein (DUF1684 family)
MSFRRLLAAVLATAALIACSPVVDKAAHRAEVEDWHAKRIARLTSETGWLTLVGLYWFKPGENSFGRAPSNALVLDNAALPDTLGAFNLAEGRVHFTARPGAEVTHDGAPVTSLALDSDASEQGPTILAAGTLRFFVIERSGRIGLRVRDTQNPQRLGFKGIERYPVDPGWVYDAQWVPYDPPRPIKIGTIIGTVEEMPAWGQLRFRRGLTTYALDAVLEVPGDTELFVMFKDATSGRGTYGAGRFLYIPIPKDPTKPGTVRVDFNRAYNPPCAFSGFATCPLPPPQNRLPLAVTAGERDYGHH